MRVVTWNVRSLHRIGTFKTVDTMSCIILRGPLCIIDLNVHAPFEDTGFDVKGSCYEELGCFPMSSLGTMRKFCWANST
jgi:hypothetical protein